MFLTEAIHYLIFLLLLSSAAFLNFTRNDQYDYYFTKGITDALDSGAFSSNATIGFSEIVSGDQVFEWLQNTLVPTLYNNEWYNGDTYATDELFFVAGYNRFLGAVRVKQIRANDDDCRVAKSLKADVPFCYQNSVSKFSFGPNNKYKWIDDGEESSFRSTYSHSLWGSGGFIEEFNMSMSATEATAKINELSTNRWIDKGTRVIVISLTVYNPNINRLGSVRMIVEILTGGEAFPSIQVTPMKALNYADASDLAQTVIELICLTYVAIEFFYRELLEIKSNIQSNSLYDEYLTQSWNYYEWSIIALTIAVAITRITNGINLGILSYDPNGPYLDTQSLGDRFIVEKALFAVLLLLCFLRGLKLLRIPPFTGPVTQSIMDSIKARTVIVFLTLFILIIFSYSLAFSIAFGAQLFNYRNIGSSFITLIRMAFGDINYDELEQTNYVLGPILFITFVFFVTLVLMNLLVAILSEVYMNSQQQNEAAWERYITKLWIENVENPNAFFLTKFISSLLHHTNRLFHYAVLTIKYQFQQYQSKRKSSRNLAAELATISDEYQVPTEIEYEDADLDELAEQLREKRINKSTNDVFTKVSALEKKIADIEPLKEKIDSMDAKMNRIEKMLTQLTEKKKKN